METLPRYRFDLVWLQTAARAVAICMVLSVGLSGCTGKAKDPVVKSSKDGRFVVVLHGEVDKRLAKPILTLLEANADRVKADLGVQDSSTYTVHVRSDEKEFLSIMQKLTGSSYPGCTGYISEGTGRNSW